MQIFSWNVIFSIDCNGIFEKSAGPADRKVRFQISPKNYTVNPYAYKALKIGQL